MPTDTTTSDATNNTESVLRAPAAPPTVVPDIIGAASAEQRAVLEQACTLLAKVIANPAFKEKVEKADYKGGRSFRTKTGKVIQVAPTEIVKIIMEGRERDTPKDSQLDMKIVPHRHPRGVVGSAVLGKGPIRPAIWFLNRCAEKKDAISMARHLMHEWLHVAGFFHRRKGPGQDDVPYQVGDIVREVAKQAGNNLVDGDLRAEFLVEDAEAANYLHLEDEVEFSDDQEWWSSFENDETSEGDDEAPYP